jgi:hypothetical protein
MTAPELAELKEHIKELVQKNLSTLAHPHGEPL